MNHIMTTLFVGQLQQHQVCPKIEVALMVLARRVLPYLLPVLGPVILLPLLLLVVEVGPLLLGVLNRLGPQSVLESKNINCKKKKKSYSKGSQFLFQKVLLHVL